MVATKEQLKIMQEKEIAIFRVFIDICERLHLRYYILGGTLLGAVRHKGFIPWDDDIDVGMMRKDYDIFIREAAKYLPEGLFLQTVHSEPEYHSNAAKIRDCNTTYIESGVKSSRINHGIFVDIFPLDNYPTNIIEKSCFLFFKKVLSARINKVYIGNADRKTIKGFLRSCLVVAFPSLQNTVKIRENLYKAVKYTGVLVNHSGMWGEKEIVLADWFQEGCRLDFEGISVNAPQEYEKWLTHFYGNYMELPPVEKRVTHHEVEVIDLERPYTDYIT